MVTLETEACVALSFRETLEWYQNFLQFILKKEQSPRPQVKVLIVEQTHPSYIKSICFWVPWQWHFRGYGMRSCSASSPTHHQAVGPQGELVMFVPPHQLHSGTCCKWPTAAQMLLIDAMGDEPLVKAVPSGQHCSRYWAEVYVCTCAPKDTRFWMLESLIYTHPLPPVDC